MIPSFKTKFLLLGCLLLGGAFQVAPVQAQTRDDVRMIEQEYSRTHAGSAISDAQLEYYLDRRASGWSMSRINADIAATGTWRPAQGWAAREVICSSVNGRHSECPVPFRGTAMLTQQISNSACIEGRTWGQRPGAVWVDSGCRARFGIVRNMPPEKTLTCNSYKGRYHECQTGFRGQAYLKQPTRDSGVCVEGRTWGQKPGVIWVRNNCRGVFSSVGRPGPRDDVAGGWTRRPNYAVTCSSVGGGRQICGWDDRYGTPMLIQQISSSACVQGRDWGYASGGGIWVTGGCRATFGYGDVSYSDDYGYNNYGYRNVSTSSFVRDPNYSVTCSSTNSGRTICTWDARYGNPYLIEQMSSSQCVEGRDWGYDVNGGLWVNSGCRARFGYR